VGSTCHIFCLSIILIFGRKFFGDFIFLFVVLFNQDSFIEASFFWRGWDEGGVGTVD